MFDTELACSQIDSLLAQLEADVCKSAAISTKEVKLINELREHIDATCDLVNNRYQKSGDWQDHGYLSAKTALVHTLGLNRRSVATSLAHGELVARFDCVRNAISENKITHDHSTILVPLVSDKYIEFFSDDVNLLVYNACKLSAEQFSHVVHHWKNMVDALIDEPADEYKNFMNRKLFLSEISDGKYIISGELDITTGKILDKALKDISEQLWRQESPELRSNYTPAQQRADAIGYLAQGYVSKYMTAQISAEGGARSKARTSPLTELNYTPALSADLIIDIQDLDKKSTHEYLTQALTTAPLKNTHSQSTVEQLLCDTIISTPIKQDHNKYDLGRTTRTVPAKFKKQLLLTHKTCSIQGCCTPSMWCDAHHIQHWSKGGPTNIDNLMLLCRRHHTMIHNDREFAEKANAVAKDRELCDSG